MKKMNLGHLDYISSLIFLIFLLYFYLNLSLRGFDLSDEGMYLLSAIHGNSTFAFNSQFGMITDLLLDLSLHQLWLFRFSGIIIFHFISFFFCFQIYKLKLSRTEKIIASEKTFWYPLKISLIIPPFYYSLGLITPSYNWINLVSTLLFVGLTIQFCRIKNPNRFEQLRFLFISELIAFAAGASKLTTGLAILIVLISIFVFLHFQNRINLRDLAISLLSSLLIVTPLILSITENLKEFIATIFRGHELLKILDSSYSILNSTKAAIRGYFDWFLGTYLENRWLILFGIIIYFFFFIFGSRIKTEFRKPAYFLFSQIFLEGYILVEFIKGNWRGDRLQHLNQLWSSTTYLILAICVFVVHQKYIGNFTNQLYSLRLPFIALITFATLATLSFGSNNGLLNQTSYVGGVFLIFAWLLVDEIYKTRVKNVARTFAIMAIVLSLLMNTWQHPYGITEQKPSLRYETIRVSVGEDLGNLYLNPKLTEEIMLMRKSLTRHGWIYHQALLDFTYFSPGLVLLLEGMPPATLVPTVGGFLGTNALATWTLNREISQGNSEKWSKAWLLVEERVKYREGSPNPKILKLVKREFPNDYIEVYKDSSRSIWKPR